MRTRLAIVFTVLTILTFRLASRSQNGQQEEPIIKATTLIKRLMTDNSKEVIDIEIVNSHNGHYIITSSLSTGEDSVRLLTNIVNMRGDKRDTLINLSKQTFFEKLERNPHSAIKIAGHLQTISIKKGDLKEVFQTRDGRSLMTLLEYGQ